MYNTIFFDLDGTLTDPGMGITNSVAYALKKWNIEVSDRTELYKFIGPPLIDSFMNYYGFAKEEARQGVKYYREYFSTKGLFENEVYEGVIELLNRLKADGKRLVIATSKPEKFTLEILKHFDLYKFFDFVAGASMDETRTKKDEVIAYALESLGIKDVSDVLMIGDREHDIFGAKAHGLDSMGVLYGYGDRDELEKAGATYIVEKVQDIGALINEI